VSKNQMGVLTFQGSDIDGRPIKGQAEYHTYTCGHCSNIVVMRPDRVKPREMCFSCGKWICGKSEVCAKFCTPLVALADDGMEAPEKWKRLVPAIMGGANSVNQAIELGLLSQGEL
jgi:hypothetical protein